MTKRQVERLAYLSRKLRRAEERFAELGADISAKTPDGMPFNFTGSSSNPTEDVALDMLSTYNEIINTQYSIIKMINTIENNRAYEIYFDHFIKHMSFGRIAKEQGVSKESIKGIYYREIF